jgi:hypothetical protein
MQSVMARDPSYELPLADVARMLDVCEQSGYRFSFLVSGGEPLLYSNLIPCLRMLRKSPVTQRIKLFTNALRIDAVSQELVDLVDVFRISAYNDNQRNSATLVERYGCKKVKVVDRAYHFGPVAIPLADALPPDCKLDCQPRMELLFYGGRIYWCSQSANHHFRHRLEGEISTPLAPHFLDNVETMKAACRQAACGYCTYNTKVQRQVPQLLEVGIARNPIPVMVLCKDRVPYLDITLKSLSATTPANVPVYVLNDGSELPDMRNYLTTGRLLDIGTTAYPTHATWRKYVGSLPDNRMVYGVGDKVNVILHRGDHALDAGMRKIFTETSASHLIRVEGDVIFKDGWYEIMCQETEQRVGILEGFVMAEKPARLTPYSSHFDEVQGRNTGQLMRIARSVIPALGSNPVVKGTDTEWLKKCRRAGMQVLATRPRVCQHIGIESEYWLPNEKPFFDSAFNRGDATVLPPYALSHEVKRFRIHCPTGS